jgi:hypothetical protein
MATNIEGVEGLWRLAVPSLLFHNPVQALHRLSWPFPVEFVSYTLNLNLINPCTCISATPSHHISFVLCTGLACPPQPSQPSLNSLSQAFDCGSHGACGERLNVPRHV